MALWTAWLCYSSHDCDYTSVACEWSMLGAANTLLWFCAALKWELCSRCDMSCPTYLHICNIVCVVVYIRGINSRFSELTWKHPQCGMSNFASRSVVARYLHFRRNVSLLFLPNNITYKDAIPSCNNKNTNDGYIFCYCCHWQIRSDNYLRDNVWVLYLDTAYGIIQWRIIFSG